MARRSTIYTCQGCGYHTPKWLGRCPDCGAWESFVEERVPEGKGGASGIRNGIGTPVPFDSIESQDNSRLSTGLPEFDRVLGGGLVPGSLVLIGGEPGVGKSTLLLQVAGAMGHGDRRILYVSGEESERQLKLRGERIGVSAPGLYVLPETELSAVESAVSALSPGLVIVDSIQTVFSPGLESAPGSISQIRDCATRFLFLAKSTGIPVLLIGHINKEGSIAGPKALEHIVDAVLYFEGERHHNHRIVRAAKNRFGAASEVALFEMTGKGLMEVGNPSAVFLAERPADAPGTAVLCCVEGSRPLLVEVQALVSLSSFSAGRRMTQGYDRNRLSLLLAMLDRVAGLGMLGADVYLNMAGGLSVEEPAADLGIVASVVGSFRNRSIPRDAAFMGEVGLTGEVRAVPQASLRIREAAGMGFTRCFVPAGNQPLHELPSGIEPIFVRTVNELLDQLF